jgi:hypothetical protein
MRHVVILGIGAVLMLATGCNKTKVAATTPAPPGGSDSFAPPSETPVSSTEANPAIISDLLVRLAPDYGYTYDAGTLAITGPGTTAYGKPISVCAGEVQLKLKGVPGGGKASNIEPAVRQFYEELRPAGEQAEKGAGAGTASGTTAAQGSPKLVPAKTVVGLWRSIREEDGKLVVNHNDDYYDLLTVSVKGTLQYDTYRKGALFATTKFSYKYDPRSGKMGFYSATDGKLVETKLALSNPSDPKLLYLERTDDQSRKVFKNLTRGDAPLTKEELENLASNPSAPGTGAKAGH